MNAFGEALNLVFMRGSGDFSSGSMPMDSISDCIPMSSYSQPMNLRLHSHEFLFPAKFLESFGWVPPMSYHPYSKRAHRSPKNCILARFWGYPYTYHMGTPKIA